MLASVATDLTNRFVGADGNSNVVISRQGGADPANPTPISTKPITAFVRKYTRQEIVRGNGAIEQGDTMVVLMATALQLLQAAFGSAGPVTIRNTDKISINGQERAIIAPEPLIIGVQTVRINLQVRG